MSLAMFCIILILALLTTITAVFVIAGLWERQTDHKDRP